MLGRSNGFPHDPDQPVADPCAVSRIGSSAATAAVSEPVCLYLLRHAHAVSEEDDPDRPLSTRGHGQARALAAFLRARGGLRVERVWHSPLLRAQQTAEHLCAGLALAAQARAIDGLLPCDDVRGIARRLAGFGHSLLVVGHEPHLGRLASMLVCGNVDQEIVDFRKAALLCLAREAARAHVVLWRIRWYVTPDLVADGGHAPGEEPWAAA
jgi:phosphohistidine phosphatase